MRSNRENVHYHNDCESKTQVDCDSEQLSSENTLYVKLNERGTALRHKDVELSGLGDRLLVPLPTLDRSFFTNHEEHKDTGIDVFGFRKASDVVSTYVHISHPHNLLFPALIKCRFTGVIALPSNNAPKVFL